MNTYAAVVLLLMTQAWFFLVVTVKNQVSINEFWKTASKTTILRCVRFFVLKTFDPL